MVDVVGLYDALLSAGVTATFRGLDFIMLDSSDETGRRALRHFFPGQDATQFQDLGAMDGQIAITGFVIGDDYVNQVARLRGAFRTAGVATLLHPWLGELQVVLMSPVAIAFARSEFRVARFTCVFAPFVPRSPPVPDVLTSLLNAVQDLRTQAGALIAQVLAPVGLGLAVLGYVQSFASQVAGIFTSLVGANSAASAAVAGPVAALQGFQVGSGGVVSATAGAQLASALAAPSAALALSSATLHAPAIGPATVPQTTPVDARITSAILLNATAAVSATASGPQPAPALALAAASLILADAIDASTDIAFVSQQQASAASATLCAAIDAAALLAVLVAATNPVPAGLVWNALQAARSNVVAVLAAELGVLPAVVTITVPADMPAWLIAQALAGDAPATLVATLNDLVARNHLRGTQARAGTLEALR